VTWLVVSQPEAGETAAEEAAAIVASAWSTIAEALVAASGSVLSSSLQIQTVSGEDGAMLLLLALPIVDCENAEELVELFAKHTGVNLAALASLDFSLRLQRSIRPVLDSLEVRPKGAEAHYCSLLS
jgi:uncharacterized membrane protein